MISHLQKCLFIHIPCTAGSTIEKLIIGKDWQLVDPRTKHMGWYLSYIHYKKYWSNYFKFSIVRNPFDLMISLYSKSRPNKDMEEITFKEYIMLCDRFKSLNWEHPLNRIQLPLHKNLLHMQFIGKFENIEQDWGTISKMLKIKCSWTREKLHENKRDKNYRKYYDEETKELVQNLFAEDLERYNYEF